MTPDELTDVLALLDEVERLRIENEHMSRALKDAVDLQKVARQDAFQRGAEAMREACQQWCRAWENNGDAIADALGDQRVSEEPTDG